MCALSPARRFEGWSARAQGKEGKFAAAIRDRPRLLRAGARVTRMPTVTRLEL